MSLADADRFARTGRSLGDKCDKELKTLVPEHLEEAFIGLAAIAGVSKAEYLRALVVEHTYGRLTAIRMHAQVPSGEGPE